MNIYNIAIGIIICMIFISLIIIFCVLLAKLYIKKIKSYTQQLFQKDLDFQKTLTASVIETQEQVLNNISQDLHDDAGQQLTAINFQLENLKLDSPELKETLEPLTQSVGQLSQSIRSISHALSHQLVVQQDLLKAIATEMERIQKNSKLHIVVTMPTKSQRAFSANEKIIIYRIFQEALNNCLKHAKATQLSVTISTTPQFEMVFTDNGIGFDAMKQKPQASLGLYNMQQRAASIGYGFQMTSSPTNGTTLTLTEHKNT